MMNRGEKVLNLCRKFGIPLGAESIANLRWYDEIKTAMEKAANKIRQAKADYIKRTLNARNKNEVATLAKYDRLREYKHRDEIQEAFGWAAINADDRDELESLWDERERLGAESGKVNDLVTQLLDTAIMMVGDKYLEELFKIESAMDSYENRATEIHRKREGWK